MYTWKILDITANDEGLITEARYFVSIKTQEGYVETEGNCFFKEPKLTIPFESVTEADVVKWVKEATVQNGHNSVEYRLNEQLKKLIEQHTTVAPWMPQIFTPNI